MTRSVGNTVTDAKIAQNARHCSASKPNIVLGRLPVDHFDVDFKLLFLNQPVNGLLFTANLINELVLQGRAAEIDTAFFQAWNSARGNLPPVLHQTEKPLLALQQSFPL